MIKASPDERVTLTMAMAIDYVTSMNSMRSLAEKYGVGKSTVHHWITVLLPTIDPQLYKIVDRKICFFKKQDYFGFRLTRGDRILLMTRKRIKYKRIISAYSKDFKDTRKNVPKTPIK